MIHHPTTFVVGAGASCDYGFPLGEALTWQIAAALTMDGRMGSPTTELMRTAITLVCQRPDRRRPSAELFNQARDLRFALVTASSIDAFLESRSDSRDFELLGKMAIAACLITAEHRCQVLKQSRPGAMIDLAQSEKSWLGRLFKHVMAPGVSKSNIERLFEHASFVVFNYDRCIEHYFEHAVASHFSVDLRRAADFVRDNLKIVHPYGYLGELHGDASLSFGHEFYPEAAATGEGIFAISQRLLTFTESQKAQGAEARALLEKALRVVFLGFGFGDQNVELLSVSTNSVQEVRATVKCWSESNRRELDRRMRQMLGVACGPQELRDGDCATLIADEQMFLTRR